jgi:HrpA-like RNA helicase
MSCYLVNLFAGTKILRYILAASLFRDSKPKSQAYLAKALDPPASGPIQKAICLLQELRALDEDQMLSSLGEYMVCKYVTDHLDITKSTFFSKIRHDFHLTYA